MAIKRAFGEELAKKIHISSTKGPWPRLSAGPATLSHRTLIAAKRDPQGGSMRF
jgi:hypothetical protein